MILSTNNKNDTAIFKKVFGSEIGSEKQHFSEQATAFIT
jgi:hypothetical protein